MTQDPDLTIPITADMRGFRSELLEADRLAQNFGRSLSGAFASAVVRGRDLSSVMRSLALSLSQQTISAAIKPLGDGLTSFLGNMIGSILPFAKGGAFTGGAPIPFADGGIIAAPSYFPMQGGRLGLMGEAGAEAIMPLARGADGRLGVRMNGANSPAQTSVHITINAQNAESFRRSESDITASLARAVARGQRYL
jgi:phage-related minor tail protein